MKNKILYENYGTVIGINEELRQFTGRFPEYSGDDGIGNHELTFYFNSITKNKKNLAVGASFKHIKYRIGDGVREKIEFEKSKVITKEKIEKTNKRANELQKLIKKSQESKLAFSNQTVSVNEADKANMIMDLEKHFKEIMKVLRIDYENDPNSKDTPKRLSKMLINELFVGRYSKEPDITLFDNDQKYSQLIMVENIDVKSVCSHHWQSINGKAIVAILPSIKKGSKVIGLSKYTRVVDYFARRPQIQENLTKQIAEYLYKVTKSEGVAVKIIAKHNCCGNRGVNQDTVMSTTELLGMFKDSNSLKSEFLANCQSIESRMKI